MRNQIVSDCIAVAGVIVLFLPSQRLSCVTEPKHQKFQHSLQTQQRPKWFTRFYAYLHDRRADDLVTTFFGARRRNAAADPNWHQCRIAIPGRTSDPGRRNSIHCRSCRVSADIHRHARSIAGIGKSLVGAVVDLDGRFVRSELYRYRDSARATAGSCDSNCRDCRRSDVGFDYPRSFRLYWISGTSDEYLAHRGRWVVAGRGGLDSEVLGTVA